MSSTPIGGSRGLLRSRATARLTLATGVLLILGFGLPPVEPVRAARQPDIFVIMLDDHAYIPNERVLKRLPNIRKHFLDGGMRLRQMHNETPLCCPARANFLSGQHTYRNRVVRNDGNPLDQTKTVATALDAAGYRTVLVGKFLNRYTGDLTPPGWDRISIPKTTYSSQWWRNGKLRSYAPMFIDDAGRKQIVEWTRKAPTRRPLFAVSTPKAPHAFLCLRGSRNCFTPKVMPRDVGARECRSLRPFKPPTYRLRRGGGNNYPQPNWKQGWKMPPWPDGWRLTEICESLLVIDRMVGQLVRAQKARNRPAYFFLFSDNGMSWGQKGLPWKRVPNSTRMATYVKGPGIKPGSSSGTLRSIIDIPVTIADIAGADMPWADGSSFLPVLKGKPFEPREEILEMMHEYPAGTGDYQGWEAIRTPTWHYIRRDDGTRLLYRYRKDIWERRNLRKAEPAVVADLDRRLDALLRAAGAP